MKNERIEGTILIDVGHPTREGAFARTTLPGVDDVQVDFDGKIWYAVAGEPGSLVWWFAGVGTIHQSRSGRENAQVVGWL